MAASVPSTPGPEAGHFVPSALFPVPALDRYDSSRYGLALTALGCPRSCSLCVASRLWSPFSRRPRKEVAAEIASRLLLFPESSLLPFVDALLIGKEEPYPLCRALEAFPSVPFHAPDGLHGRGIDGPRTGSLSRRQFRTLRLSSEGGDDVVGGAGTGRVSTADDERARNPVRRARYGDAEPETYLLAGLPGRTFEETVSSIDDAPSRGGPK